MNEKYLFSSDSIHNLKLSVRARNCFRCIGIESIEQLRKYTDEELLRIPNFGKTTLLQIKSELKKIGLSVHTKNDLSKQPIHKKLTKKRFAKLLLTVDELFLPVRPARVLDKLKINYIGDLIHLHERELLKTRNFGRKSLSDLKQKLKYLNLQLGMTVESWPPSDIAETLKEHRKELTNFRKKESYLVKKLNESDVQILEDELEAFFSQFALNEKNWTIVKKFYGFDGKGKKTLERVGKEFGMTRERIRQICDKFENHLDAIPQKSIIPLRFTNAVNKTLLDKLPILANQIETEIVNAGLTKKRFMLEGLKAVNDLLNRKNKFAISVFQRKRFITTPDKSKLPRNILLIARRTIEHWGIATIADIAAQATNDTNIDVDENFVSSVLSCVTDFSWLDNEKSWFWLKEKPSRSRLRNLIRKVLCVSDKIEISELRVGVGRYHRMEGFSPPKHVLLELCKQLPWCEVDGTFVAASPKLDWNEVLDRSSTEWGMAGILKEYGPVLPRLEFQRKCEDIGMSTPAFFQGITYSPIISKFTSGVYGLRGSKIFPGKIESITPKKTHKKVVTDYGYTSDFKIWVAYKISSSMIETGVFSIPSAMSNFIQEKFDLVTPDCSFICCIKIIKSSGWDIKPLFKRRGGEVGDYLVLKFDVQKRQIQAYIGDQDLLEDFQS